MSRCNLTALLCCLLLAGCAVGGGRMNVAADRPFERAALDGVVPGMAEPEVVARLGLPVAFGVDERGRRYLQYSQFGFASTVFGAGTGPIGVNALMVQASASGFEARVYIEAGRVTRVATRVYEPPEGTAGDAGGDLGGDPGEAQAAGTRR